MPITREQLDEFDRLALRAADLLDRAAALMRANGYRDTAHEWHGQALRIRARHQPDFMDRLRVK